MNYHAMNLTEAEEKLGTDFKSGLSASEAEKRLKSFGPNRLEEKKPPSLIKRFFSQFSDFCIIVLIISAAISFAVSALNSDKNLTDPLIIMAIVILNAIIGTVQEARAENAISALKRLTDPKAICLRNGKRETVSSEAVVPGDVIFLSAGSMVPADARIIEASDFCVNESALTGESEPVKKNSAAVSPNCSVPERADIVYASSLVTSGHAKAAVICTGMNTHVGHVAKMIGSPVSNETPLSKRLSSVSKLLALGAIFCCFVIFAVGLIKQYDPFFMFMTGVSLAVAAIPEGLPAIVTVMLAMGVSRMARKKAVIRSLPAVETLGSATVICTDKTGTLTLNEMTVACVFENEEATLTLMALASDSDGKSGSGTEAAIVKRYGGDVLRLRSDRPRIAEIPFSSERKRMATVNRINGETVTIVKGAFDSVLERCNRFLCNGCIRPMSPSDKKRLAEQCSASAKKGLRVLSVAAKRSGCFPDEAGLCYIGSLALSDPLRPEAKKAISSCKRAGINVIMITGDHAETAKSIAAELKLKSTETLTGAEIAAMSDEALKKALRRICVFARVLPEQKLRIVNALKADGHIVAMTGDGVNDAPALKAADIGCAMGKSGTDVARAASDMVLTDDNFSTVVQAVKEGRIIYKNIKKAIHFLISSNIGEILLMLAGMLSGLGAVLLPIQLLWVNLITDSLPAIALGMDRADSEIMNERPQNPKKGFFSDGLGADILAEGLLIGAVSIAAYSFGRFSLGGGEGVGRTIAFCTLSISQLVHAFNVRSEKSVFKAENHNKWLIAAAILGLFMQCLVCIIGPLTKIFKTVPLSARQWLAVFLFSLVPLAAEELSKLTKVRK